MNVLCKNSRKKTWKDGKIKQRLTLKPLSTESWTQTFNLSHWSPVVGWSSNWNANKQSMAWPVPVDNPLLWFSSSLLRGNWVAKVGWGWQKAKRQREPWKNQWGQVIHKSPVTLTFRNNIKSIESRSNWHWSYHYSATFCWESGINLTKHQNRAHL